MNCLCIKKRVLIIAGIMIGLIGIVGCSHQPYKPVRQFPAPTPKNAKVSLNFNSEGRFFIADEYGEAVKAQIVPFAKILKKSSPEETESLEVLGSYALYRIGNNGKVLLCDNTFECAVGSIKEKSKDAVFSINFDGKKLFLADTKGEKIDPKNLSPFASLIKQTEFRNKMGIKTLNNLTIYKMKGSIKLSGCSPNNICTCACYCPAKKKTVGCISGECPPGVCN